MFSAASADQIGKLSGATVAHINSAASHVSAADRTKWNDGANSGASAWTSVIAIGQKAIKMGEKKNTGNIFVDKALTIFDLNSGSNIRTLNISAQSSSTLTNMASGEVIEAHVVLDNSTAQSGKTINFSNQITGATIVRTCGSPMYIEAGGYGEANIMVMKTGDSSYEIYLITT
jgi:hypothetical protein